MSQASRGVTIEEFDPKRDSFEELTILVTAAFREVGDMGLDLAAGNSGPDVPRRLNTAPKCWVARKDGNLVGTICYYNSRCDRTESDWYSRDHVCHVGQLAVDPSLAGSGIGTMLMNKAERQAISDGKLELSCDAAEAATHAVSWCLRLGFRPVGAHKRMNGNSTSVVLSKRLGISIRKATERDGKAIPSVSETAQWEKSAFLKRMLSRNAIDVARDGEQVVGFNAWNNEFFSRPFIWLIVVDRNHRGSGIGSLLIANTERDCKGSRLYSSTNRSNNAMQRFLERRGYRRAGELELDPGDPELFYCIDL